jgi:hypothetical protein
MKHARSTWLVVSPSIAIAAIFASTVHAKVISVSANGFELLPRRRFAAPTRRKPRHERVIQPIQQRRDVCAREQ